MTNDTLTKPPDVIGEQLDPATVAQLRAQLDAIYRDALGIVRTVELARGVPPHKSAIRTRAERRQEIDTP